MNAINVLDLANSHESRRAQWVDVRSPGEFAAGHLPGAVNIPLEEVNVRMRDFHPDFPVVLICKSGMRARMGSSALRQCRQDVSVLNGGTDAWVKAGLPLVSSIKTRWSLERQVRFIAGVLVLLGAVLAVTVKPLWVYLAGFIGLGLTFAGLTDICAMGILLAKMPWNGVRQCVTPAIAPTSPSGAKNAER